MTLIYTIASKIVLTGGVGGNCARELCVLYLESAGSRNFDNSRLRVFVSSRAAGGTNYEQDFLGYKPAAMD